MSRSSGERYQPFHTGPIRAEHLHRYASVRHLAVGRDVLDIACGEGYGSALLSDAASSVIGVDVAVDAIAHAQRTYGDERLRFVQGDAAAIPLDDDAVDLVVSFETLEHLADHAAMLHEIRRVLRPDGIFVLSSPNRAAYNAAIAEPNPYHVAELEAAELDGLLRTVFPAVRLYAQGTVSASLVTPRAAVPAAVTALGFPAPHDPIFALAVCAASASSLPTLEASIYLGQDFTAFGAADAELRRFRTERRFARELAPRIVAVAAGGEAAAAALLTVTRAAGTSAGNVDSVVGGTLEAGRAFALTGAAQTVQGWAALPGPRVPDLVIMTIAGHAVAAAPEPRPDLRAAYGDALGAGYLAALPASLPPGLHEVRVWALDLAAGERRDCGGITLAVFEPREQARVTERLCIDAVEVIGSSADMLHVSATGWAVDAFGRAFDSVALVADRVAVVPVRYAGDRADVAQALQTTTSAVGWSAEFALEPGDHELHLAGLNGSAGSVSRDRRFITV